MTKWHDVGAVEDFPEGEPRECIVDGAIIAVFRVEDGVYAMDGICPHQGGPLGKGTLCGHVLTCPWHGWQYDITTGAHLINASIVHPTFPAKVEEGRVWVLLDSGDNSDP